MYAKNAENRLQGGKMDEKFSSLESLYERLLPALRSKEKELHLNKMTYITKQDIWECLRVTKWNRGVNLTLFDMVNDILNTGNEDIDEFVRNEREKERNYYKSN